MSQTRQHETVISLPASPDEVWKSISTAAGLEVWFAPEARIDARVGGEYFVSWGEGMGGGGTIEICEPGSHLRFASARGPAFDIYLTAEAGGTVLRLVHSGYLMSADWDSEFNGTKHGWPIMLRLLQDKLRRYPDVAGKQNWLYVSIPAPRAEAWARVEKLLSGGAEIYRDAPNELAAEWSEWGPGMVYADLSGKGEKTGVSFYVVLYGDALPRLAEAGELWKQRLSGA